MSTRITTFCLFPLPCVFLLTLASQSAWADCSPNPVDQTSDGTVICSGIDRDGVSINETNMNVNVQNSALVQGTVGIDVLQAGGNVNNDGGTISATDMGLVFAQYGSVTNQNGGIINGMQFNGIQLQNGGEVNNFGTVEGGLTAVNSQNGGTFVNDDGGSIEGVFTGIRAVGNNTVVNNAGTITGQADDGLRMQGGGVLTNSGTILGGAEELRGSSSEGILAIGLAGQEIELGTVQLVIDNLTDGVISGYRNAMNISQLNSEIYNDGMIEGGDGGIRLQRGRGEIPVDTLTSVITNTGTIQAIGGGPLVDSGFIEASQVSGVSIGTGMALVTIKNSGLITSVGAGITSSNKTVVENFVGGVIRGDSNIDEIGDAVNFISQDSVDTNPALAAANFDDTVSNAGFIIGNIMLGAGDDNFAQTGVGAQTTGQINGGDGFDTVTVNISEGENAMVDGDQFTNIEKFIKSGAGLITFEGVATMEEALVSAGILSLSSSSILEFVVNPENVGSGQLTVANGANLSGSGTIIGSVNVEEGGIVNPGFSPGTLFIDGDLNLSAGAILQIEVQELLGGGFAVDNFNISGGFSIAGGSIELLFDVFDEASTSISDYLSRFTISDFFTFQTEELLNEFTDTLLNKTIFFTTSDRGVTASQLVFNNGADFSDITLTQFATLPSQKKQVDVPEPITWLMCVISFGYLVNRRLNPSCKLNSSNTIQ